MKTVFIIKNQHRHYLSRDGSWLDWDEQQHFKRCSNYDEALNTLIEANSKDIDLRLSVVSVEIDDKQKLCPPND